MNFPPASRHVMTPDVETVVVGAGVVGLAIASELAKQGHEVVVLERHRAIGQEISSRSSEVIHAGLYYPPGSLKARLCVEGRRLLYEFATENGVPFARCGKLIVATAEEERAQLDAIERNARANGVADLVRLDKRAAQTLEPELAAVAALLSPSTGVVDSHGLMVALEGHIRNASGNVVLDTSVEGLAAAEDDPFEIVTVSAGQRATLTSRNLVIAAGLGASKLGGMLSSSSGYCPPATYPARGHYFVLDGEAPFRHLIYPVPREAWLGIHVTLDLAGRARFGPDLEWRPHADTHFDDEDGARRGRFEREIRRYWPGLPDGKLSPGYVGVRPKIYRSGEAAPDFVIHSERDHGIPRLVALYGIESPGLTSSLAIGKYVAAMFVH